MQKGNTSGITENTMIRKKVQYSNISPALPYVQVYDKKIENLRPHPAGKIILSEKSRRLCLLPISLPPGHHRMRL